MGRFLGLMKRQHPDYYPIAVDYAKESSRENISRFIEQEEPLGFPTIAKAYQR
jgi:hypothetical protein